jgi:hypothetical protein
MRELLLNLLAFLVTETGYAVPDRLPEIRLLSQDRIQATAFTGARGPELVGFYKDGVIYLDLAWDPATDKGRATLVHELTHWLQNVNGKKGPVCFWEQEAYRLSDRWYQSRGKEPPPISLERVIQTACSWGLGPS